MVILFTNKWGVFTLIINRKLFIIESSLLSEIIKEYMG